MKRFQMLKMLLICWPLFTLVAQENQVLKNNTESIIPGTSVKIRGEVFKLSKGSLQVGQNLISELKTAGIEFKFNNRPTVISFVPSIKTPVCEVQNHIMQNEFDSKEIDLVTISSDHPKIQKSFKENAKLDKIQFYSDSGLFAQAAGLFIVDKKIITRGVAVVDYQGIIRYLQLVSELTELPDMAKSYDFALSLLKSPSLQKREGHLQK